MAEEAVVAPAVSPVPSDGKRKFEDLHQEPTEQLPLESNPNAGEAENTDDAAVSDEGETKRPRLDDNGDGIGTPIHLPTLAFLLPMLVTSPFFHPRASIAKIIH